MWENLIIGAGSILELPYIIAIFGGIGLGVMIGAIPGLSPGMAMAIGIPMTYYMSPVTALSFLIGIYKGGTYGGAISSILIGTPGDIQGVCTLMDGYPLGRQGKASKAMKIAICSSVMGDTFSDVVLIMMAAPLALIAMKMGPVEIASLIAVCFTIVAAISGQSLPKGVIAGAFGFLFATIGIDDISGTRRLTFGILSLDLGIPIIPLIIGLFAMSEFLTQARKKMMESAEPLAMKTDNPEDSELSLKELKSCGKTILRSSLIGTIMGALPGLGASSAAFLSYGLAKRFSKNPERFGKGALEGVAACEAADNATCGATFIPLFTLGIPGSGIAAILLGALVIHGLEPGPLIFEKHADVIYTVYVGMLLANLANLTLSVGGIRLFARVALTPTWIVLPIVAATCIAGSYAVTSSVFDIKIMCFFGILGYFMRRYGFSLPAFILAFILEPMFERSLRRALIISDGSIMIFFTSPISLIFLIFAGILLILLIKSKKTGKGN